MGSVSAECQVRVGITHDVELERPVEDVLVEVRRAVEQPRPLALPDRHAAQFDVLQGGALKAVHRSGPPDDLVDRAVRAFPLEQLPLVRIVEERVHAVGHRVAGGFVAGHRQKDHEERELHVLHRLAVDVGLDQPRHDVVGGTAAPLLSHRVRIAHQFCVGGGRVGVEVRVVGVHDAVRPMEEPLTIRLRHPDQVRDGLERQVHRDVGDEVAGVLGGRGGDDLPGRDGQLLFERGDGARGEQPRHDLA